MNHYDKYVKQNMPEAEKLYNELTDYLKNGAAKDLSTGTKELIKDFWELLESPTSDTCSPTQDNTCKTNKCTSDSAVYRQKYNIADLDNSVEITVAVPGFNSSNIEVTYADSVVRVIGKSDTPKHNSYSVYGVELSDFNNAFKLVRPVAEIEYTVNDGLLTIIVHFTNTSEPKIRYFTR